MKPYFPLRKHWLWYAAVFVGLMFMFSFLKKPKEMYFVGKTDAAKTEKKPKPNEASAKSKKQKPEDADVTCTDEEKDANSNCYYGAVINTDQYTVRGPHPCPSGQCDEIVHFPIICFYSEANFGDVIVYLNDKVVGKATPIAYNKSRKLRSVEIAPVKTARKGDMLKLEIPYTATNTQSQMVITGRYK